MFLCSPGNSWLSVALNQGMCSHVGCSLPQLHALAEGRAHLGMLSWTSAWPVPCAADSYCLFPPQGCESVYGTVAGLKVHLTTCTLVCTLLESVCCVQPPPWCHPCAPSLPNLCWARPLVLGVWDAGRCHFPCMHLSQPYLQPGGASGPSPAGSADGDTAHFQQ